MPKFYTGPLNVTQITVAPPSGFTPAQLPGILGWFEGDHLTFQDAAGTTPATTNGQLVMNWGNLISGSVIANQQIGNSTQAGILNTSALNGLPIINFSGNSNNQILRGTALFGSSTFSVFFLCGNPTGSSIGFMQLFGPTGSDGNSFNNAGSFLGQTYFGGATDYAMRKNGVFIGNGASDFTVPTGYAQVGFVFDGGGNGNAYVNNSVQGASSTFTGNFGDITLGTACSIVSGAANVPGGPPIAAEVWSTSAFSATDLSNLHTYWKNKWGIG